MKYLKLPSYKVLHEIFTYNEKTGQLFRKRDYRKRKPIVQKTMGGLTVAMYTSIREAYRQTGVYRPYVKKCLEGKRKNAGGFIWEYNTIPQPPELIYAKDYRGYLKVRIGDKKYPVHRVVYKMFWNEEDVEKQIDHINGVRDDNRITNLRLVEQKENQRNSSLRRDNTTGIVGVYKTKYNTWLAYISNQTIGTFKTKAEAINARKKAEIKMGYTSRHGKKRSSYSGEYIKLSERPRSSSLAQQ